MDKQDIIAKAVSRFDEGYACSQSVLLAFSERFSHDDRTAKLIASTLGGGMGRLRLTSGAVTGGFMVLGLAFGNENPNDMKTKPQTYPNVRELRSRAEHIHGTTVCKELLQKHVTWEQVEERQHHKIICHKMVADAAGIVYDMISNEP